MAETGFSKSDLQEILRQQQENFMAVVAEIRKPDAKTEAKLKREEELADRARKVRLDSLLAGEQSKKLAQDRCPHRKNNGDPEAGTAIHRPSLSSDGMIHPICVECGKEFQPERPAMIEVSGMAV